MVTVDTTRVYQGNGMNRFASLEFGDADSADRDKDKGEEIRDEGFFYKRAVTCWLAGDFELALRNYSRSLEMNSSFFEGWIGQILMLLELGEYPEAIVWADKALELFPEHPELFAAKATAYIRDVRFDKAMAFSDNSVSKENVTSRVWLARAEVLMKRKSRIAENCVSKAMSIAGNSADIIGLEAGRLLRRSAKYAAALEYLNSSVKVFPKSALAWFELGCCQDSIGFSEAQVSLKESLNLRPKWELAEARLQSCKSKGPLRRVFNRIFGR
jgi:tetratricopeptide (TPR) repeat protein